MIGKQKYSTRVLLIHSWQVLVQRLDTAKANITAVSRNFGWLNWWKNKVYFFAIVNLLRVLIWKNIKYSPIICCVSCCADN